MLPCMMEIFLSAVLGELASRSIDFFISKSSKPTVMVVADRLQRALLRAQVIVDEAMEWQITNQVVLQQLDMLRDAMYRGYYILNTFKYQSQSEEDAKGQVMSNSLSLWKVNSLQGFCSSNRNTLILEQLQKSLDDLSSMIIDVEGIVNLIACISWWEIACLGAIWKWNLSSASYCTHNLMLLKN